MYLQEIVGENIKNRRLAMGLTQKQLAKKIGLNDSGGGAISYWERGLYAPGAYSLCLLADAFGCTVDELLGRGL